MDASTAASKATSASIHPSTVAWLRLARALLVTKGNVTQLLDAMEREGLLERRREGRSKRIFLTDEGRRRRTEAVALQEAAIAAEWSALDETETQTLIRLLRKLDQSLKVPS